MHLKRSALAGLTVGLMTVIAIASPAFAYSVISDTGVVGNYYLPDSAGSPGATCAYGQEVPPNWAWLKWMKVRAPQVFAADRNSELRDQRRVSWQFKIQRGVYGQPNTWHTVASSGIQRKTAWEDQAASFSAMTVYYNATTTAPGSADEITRPLVILKWYRPNGSVEGIVKLTSTYYRLKSPFGTHTSGNAFCEVRTTSG